MTAHIQFFSPATCVVDVVYSFLSASSPSDFHLNGFNSSLSFFFYVGLTILKKNGKNKEEGETQESVKKKQKKVFKQDGWSLRQDRKRKQE